MSVRIQSKLMEPLDYLASVDGLINCHVANFFTKNLWSTVLPSEICQELENMNDFSGFISQYLEFICNGTRVWSSTCPHLNDFLVQSYALGDDTSCKTPLLQVKAKIGGINGVNLPGLKLKDFMTNKKKHEVEEMVPLAQALAQMSGTTLVVDVGGGKGYLSSSLSLHCSMDVLALDSSAINTCGADKLENKMAKKTSRQQVSNCKRETVFVSPQMKLDPLLEKHFRQTARNCGLLGLHTCGNLAATSCQIFVQQNMRWMVNVGCCYHLIDEEFDTIPFWKDAEVTCDYGFPVSDFLRKKKRRLGRNARMLAAHSLQRLARDGINQEASKSLFYRAVLQVLIERSGAHSHVEGHVGRLFKKCASFHQYVRKAIQKLQLNIDLTDLEIDELLSTYADEEGKLRVFFLLRTHLAPLVESVILLDRFLFLLEQGIEDAYLVSLYDAALSPRNHAIVAWRSTS